MMKPDRKSPAEEERGEYRDKLFLELVRAAVLESFEKSPCRSEDEAALKCFWKTVNPFLVPGRDSDEETYLCENDPASEETDLPPVPPRIRTVTVHTHRGEPMTPSPDDLLLYDRLDLERGACSHFIIDGFHVKKIR
jgi:hypothetical protein